MAARPRHRNSGWLRYVEEIIRPRLHRLRDFHEGHVASVFDRIADEAQDVTEQSWDRMMSEPTWEPHEDAATCAEKARDEGLEYLLEMENLHNRVNGAICVAVWSELERFLVLLVRKGICNLKDPDRQEKNWNWDKIKSKYEEAGIALDELDEFKKVNLLRLVNNAYKHGPGRSMEELRKMLPQPYKGLLSARFSNGTELTVDGTDLRIPDVFTEESLELAENFLLAVVNRISGA